MRKYDLVVFDIDGTLLDTSSGIRSAVSYTIDLHHLRKLDEKKIDSFIGPPIKDSFEKEYGITGDELSLLVKTFRDRYKNEDLLKAIPYDGVLDVFRTLKEEGIKTAIATYKRQDYAEIIIHHFGLNKFTENIYGSDSENKLAKSDIIEMAIQREGIENKNRVLMVGDSDNDAIGAEGLGIDFLAVTYGFGFSNTLDTLAFSTIGVANSPAEILQFITGSGRDEN